MKVYNEDKTLILTEYDLKEGYLKLDKIFVKHHDAIEAVEEQGHYETIAEYPNGGKDVEWVVDVEKVEAKEAWDEYENIQIYIPYTEAELVIVREQEYEQLVEKYVREKYSLNAELAILRQRDSKPEEFAAYNTYAEECKARAKAELA